MAEEGGFILCENDYLQSSFASFLDMKLRGEHTDITIKCKSRVFSVHRVVLAARIPHFRKVLANCDKELLMDEIDPDVLESIINFAYEGKLKVTAQNVQPTLLASVCLRMEQVQKACCEFLAKRLEDQRSPAMKLIPTDINVRKNFEEFASSQEFLLLPYSYLKELISQNDLNVAHEGKVFEAVIRWVKESPMGRQSLLPYLLAEIRMSNLTPEYLVEKVATEELVRSNDSCKHIVEEAKNYHLLPKKRLSSLSFKTDARIYSEVHQNVAPISTTSNPNVVTISVVPDRIASCNDSTSSNVLNTIKYGIYAVCSFNSLGTIVSYYDDENENWCSFPAKAKGQVHGMVSVGNKIYVFFPDAVSVFHLTTHKWEKVAPLRIQVKASGIVSRINEIYIFGGFSSKAVWCFDTQQNTWMRNEDMETPVRNMGVVAPPGKYIYLTGGFTTACSNLFKKFNVISKQWTDMPPMPSCRMNHDCASLNLKIYVCGGVNNQSQLLNTADFYDPSNSQWISISVTNIPRHSLSLVSWNGKLFAVGGKKEGDDCFCGVEEYDLGIGKWVPGTPIPPLLPNSVLYPSIIKAIVVDCPPDE